MSSEDRGPRAESVSMPSWWTAEERAAAMALPKALPKALRDALIQQHLSYRAGGF